jgi:hypothetical protein
LCPHDFALAAPQSITSEVIGAPPPAALRSAPRWAHPNPWLADLPAELQGYPVAAGSSKVATASTELAGVVVPLRLVTDAGTLSLFSTTTVFGTPVDVTLSELALECFYPADAATAEALRGLAGQ